MEAMAAGKTVVCSNIKAFSEVVKNERDILLVKPGDVEELRIAIKRLMNDGKLRQTLGFNAKKTAYKNFRWQTRVEKDAAMIEMVYDKLKNRNI